MEITLIENKFISFKSWIIKEEPREFIDLLNAQRESSQEFLKICSWCKLVEVTTDEWVDVEEAIKILGLFEQLPLPQLTHGMCLMCSKELKALL
jgi:hypothetical protein